MSTKASCFIFLVILLNILSATVYASGFTVSSAAEYLKAEQQAGKGDTIFWKTGTYKDINFAVSKNYLVIRAEVPGKTIFTGASMVEIKSDSVTFSGFQFAGGKVEKDVLKVSGSHNLLEHLNFSAYHSHFYLNVVPGCSYNTIQYCNFERKPEDKTTSVVQIQVDEKEPGYHVLRYCSFKNHTAPPGAGGDYGIEALRIGYSFQAKFISRTIVEYCYFYRCNGDGEVISSKARENIFRYNTFDNNGESHFTLRHGSDNVVYGNFFLKGAGLRIKEGQNQMVYNNYFNTGDYFAIRLENYKVDPLENIIITHNTFYGSGPVRLGGKGDYPPTGVALTNNLFWDPASDMLADPTGKETIFGNATTSDKVINTDEGFYTVTAKIENNAYGFLQPERAIAEKSKSRIKFPMLDIPGLNDDPGLELDIAGNKRAVGKKSAGCYEPGKKHLPVKPYATAENTGPGYL
jgi:hypothetical protein